MILRHTRLIPAILLLTALLCSCSASPAPSLSPEERTQLYRSAIERARDQETNEALPVLSDPEDERADLLLSSPFWGSPRRTWSPLPWRSPP